MAHEAPGSTVRINGDQLDWDKLGKLGITPGEGGDLQFDLSVLRSNNKEMEQNRYALARIFANAISKEFRLPLSVIEAKERAAAARQRAADGPLGLKRLLRAAGVLPTSGNSPC
jgi:hypothetical protein